MATYGNFNNFNGLEFTNATITPDPLTVQIASLSPKQIHVNIKLEVANAVARVVRLENVNVNALDFDTGGETELLARVMDHLNANNLIT